MQRSGDWGDDDDDDEEGEASAASVAPQAAAAAARAGAKDMVALYAQRVAATTAEYQRAMGELLTLLRAQEQEQEPVRHLMFRLDFNSYYAGAGGKASSRFGSLLDDAASAGGGVRLMV